MSRASPPLFAACLLLGAACAGPPVYRPPPGGSQQLSAPPSEPGDDAADPIGTPPAAPVLTVVTLEDARPAHHRLALSSWLEEHDGYTGEAMTRDRAYRHAVDEMASDALAEALAETGRFAEVRRASRPDRADGDLVLTGRLRRLRGWQAYRVEKDEPARILESIGDVFIDEVTIVAPGSGRIAFIGQTGAMLEEPPADVDPYAAAQAAFDEAARALAGRVAEVDLMRADLTEEVRLATDPADLDALLEAPPKGWRGTREAAEVPRGWDADGPCESIHLEDETRWFFHPRLGFYRPHLRVWICAPGWEGVMRLSGDGAERFPAAVFGFDADGAAWIASSLGKTSWPSARADLKRAFSLSPPEGDSPVLALPPEAGRAATAPGPPTRGP